MNLNQTILDAVRDEVARERGWPDWDSLMTNMEELQHTSDACHREAALLAMEKQAEFFRWLASYYFTMPANKWLDMKEPFSDPKTELELYEIWEGQK